MQRKKADPILVSRVRILSAAFIAIALLLIVRLYFIQIVHGEEYEARASAQYVSTAKDIENRNSIFFTAKDGTLVAAATQEKGWKIAIRPAEVTKPEELLLLLGTTTDRERFYASLEKKSDPYEEVAFRLSDETAQKIRAAKLKGVILVRDSWRSYPGKRVGSHAVGFVGFRGDTRQGVIGLERFWEHSLSGTSGLSINPFAEIFTNINSLVSDPTQEEGSIITTIEPSVQGELESTLAVIVQKHTPRTVGGIVMDPRTGAILAIAQLPDFDPNAFNVVEDQSVFTTTAVERVYEMGSIIKALTFAAGLDSGVITAKTQYEDKGCIKRSDATICNFDGKARGVVPMQEVLNQSLNTGVTFIEEKMGAETFSRYFKAFGLGEKTDIDLPGEVSGKIRNIESGVAVDLASASFGQGIALTPIATIRALSTLANGGTLPDPHIARAIKYDTGVTRAFGPFGDDARRVLRPETSQEISRVLAQVFDDALLNGELKQERYTIAAKTGTAQMALPNGGGYYEDRYMHTFFGYFPSKKPEFIVLLYALEPNGERYASHTLSRPFMGLAKFLLNYYNVAPDR